MIHNIRLGNERVALDGVRVWYDKRTLDVTPYTNFVLTHLHPTEHRGMGYAVTLRVESEQALDSLILKLLSLKGEQP